ncbi:MAG: class I tRNA ligase family protein, partial [SAR324 cluster bacterium]|nr:class I tRNA ligase family protein [SAR324 cluster bacterium]
MTLSKTYDPHSFESEIYKKWEENGVFRADNTSEATPFTISMPPPNATGQLHVGHAVMLALEDILIRWHRMKGDEALWLPGTDHAAIATENVVLNQ